MTTRYATVIVGDAMSMPRYWERFYAGLHTASARPVVEIDLRTRLERARSLMHAHYDEPLDLEAIARTVHMSRFHFARSFRREFDESPHQYLTQRRLERAKDLLVRTDATVTEVCLAVGFSSLGSFSSLFGRHTGQSPQRYRRCLVQSLGIPTPLPLIPACFLARHAVLPDT